MFTQCPQCSTVFAVQQTQLEAREGWVRCGQCENVFCATDSLFDALPRETRPPHAVANDEERVPSPDLAESGLASPRRTHPVVWGLLTIPLVLVLAAQLVFVYRGTLALDPRAKPWVVEFCRVLQCEIPVVYDIDNVQLVDATVEAHPAYTNVLHVEAAFVNRAAAAQSLPLLELSLLDNNGTTTGRRVIRPAQYTQDERLLIHGMPTNVSINAVFDVTADADSASGYEVRLIRP